MLQCHHIFHKPNAKISKNPAETLYLLLEQDIDKQLWLIPKSILQSQRTRLHVLSTTCT